jgi:hypothetical protein
MGANAATSQAMIVGRRAKLNMFSSFLRPAGALDNLPQPDDQARMAYMGDFDDYEYDQHFAPEGRRHDPPDYYLLLDAKKWREKMNLTSPQPVISYGRGIPSSFWLKKQEALYKLLDQAAASTQDPSLQAPVRVGWIRDANGLIQANDWHSVMDIYSLMRNLKLSRAEGNEILKTFRRIADRNDATILIPSTVESVIAAVEKSSAGGSEKDTIEVTIPLSNIFFNGKYVDFGAAKAVGCMVHPCQMFMELFSNSSIADFDSRPIDLMFVDPDSPGSHPIRYIGGHATSNDFRNFCTAGVRDYGDSFMPLSVQIQTDATVYQAGGNKTITPLYYRVMNLIEPKLHEHKESVKLFAIQPVILSTSAELRAMLTLNGFANKTDQKNILVYVSRHIHQKFNEYVISKLQEYSIDGFYLTFGKSSRIDKFVVVPLVLNLPNDNQERYIQLGLKHGKHGKRNCANCTLDTDDFYKQGSLGKKQLTEVATLALRQKIDTASIRDSSVHQYLCEKAETIWMKDLMSKAKKVTTIRDYGANAYDRLAPGNNKISDSDKAFIGRKGPVYAFNCNWQACLMYNVMDYQIKNQIVTPITISWFEVLHSVYKGIVEFDFRMIMASVHLAVKNNVPGVHRNAIGLLDQRVKDFQGSQPYNLFGTKSVIIHKGFSPLFKDTKTTFNALARAVLTGGNIDANRFSFYLFYLMMSLGTDGSCLPNRLVKLRLPPDAEWVILNPTKIAIEAAVAALELVSIIKGDLFSVSKDLPRLRHATHIANSRAKSLYLLKQALGGFYNGSDTLFNIKLHGSTHSDQAILGVGEPSKYFL